MIFNEAVYGFTQDKNKSDIAEPINEMDEQYSAAMEAIRGKLPKHYLFDPETAATQPGQTEFTIEIPNFNSHSVVIGIKKQSKTTQQYIPYAPTVSKPITSIVYDDSDGTCTITFAEGFESGWYYDIVFVNY